MKRRRISGFTLVELMVVVAIVAIIASIASPVADLIDRRRLTAASEAVYSLLQLARSESIKQGQNITVNFQRAGGNGWCMGITSNAACDCTLASGAGACTIFEDETRTTPAVKRVVGSGFNGVSVASGAAVNLEFDYRRGTLAALGINETSFVFTSTSGAELRVIANRTGRIRACSANNTSISGYRPC